MARAVVTPDAPVDFAVPVRRTKPSRKSKIALAASKSLPKLAGPLPLQAGSDAAVPNYALFSWPGEAPPSHASPAGPALSSLDFLAMDEEPAPYAGVPLY